MKVEVYANQEQEEMIRAAIKIANGHCPCVLERFRNEDTKCMCKDFRDLPVGSICNCGLYIKTEN